VLIARGRPCAIALSALRG